MRHERGAFTTASRALAGVFLLIAAVTSPLGLTPRAAAAGGKFTITVWQMVNAGSGTISSTDGRIGCTVTHGVASGICSFTYSSDTQVNLQATPENTFNLTCHLGSCSVGRLVDVVQVTADTTYGAFGFQLVDVPIYVGKLGPGAGSISSSSGGISCGSTCSASYPFGTDVTLKATAAAGSTFSSWDNEGPCAASGPTCTFSAADYSTIYAIFGTATAPPSTPPATPHPASPPPPTGAVATPIPTGAHHSPTPGPRDTTRPPGSPGATDVAASPIFLDSESPSFVNIDPSPLPSGHDGPVGSTGDETIVLALALVVAGGLVAIGLFLGLRRSSGAGSDRHEPPAS